MKTTLYKFILISLVSLLASCEDEDEIMISNEEAAEEVAVIISTDFMNIGTDATLIAEDAESGRSSSLTGCGISYDTTITRTYTGTYISYAFTLDYGYLLSCTELGVPTSLAWDFASEGTWNGVRINSEGTSTGSLTVTDLQLAKSQYRVNGSLERMQVLTQEYHDQKTFTTECEVAITDFTIDKSSAAITGGSASFSASGISSAGGSYEYTCTVVFNGDETATLTMADGTAFTLDLITGEID